MASKVPMVDPAERKRKRYVGFRVHVEDGPPPDRQTMVRALDRACREVNLPDQKRLTVFTGDLGIAKCEHKEQEDMLQALASIDQLGDRSSRVQTLVTSGTIKKVKGHLGLDAND